MYGAKAAKNPLVLVITPILMGSLETVVVVVAVAV
jgi:hypothetical protein